MTDFLKSLSSTSSPLFLAVQTALKCPDASMFVLYVPTIDVSDINMMIRDNVVLTRLVFVVGADVPANRSRRSGLGDSESAVLIP